MKITIETDGNVIYKCEDGEKNITDAWCEHCDEGVNVESDRRGVTVCIYTSKSLGPVFSVKYRSFGAPAWFQIDYCPFCGKKLRREK